MCVVFYDKNLLSLQYSHSALRSGDDDDDNALNEPMTTHVLLARVNATLIRLKSLRNPTFDFVLTQLTNTMSDSLP